MQRTDDDDAQLERGAAKSGRDAHSSQHSTHDDVRQYENASCTRMTQYDDARHVEEQQDAAMRMNSISKLRNFRLSMSATIIARGDSRRATT
jgi:hypothetical protein